MEELEPKETIKSILREKKRKMDNWLDTLIIIEAVILFGTLLFKFLSSKL